MNNITSLQSNNITNIPKKIIIGELTQDIIDLLNIDRKPCNIVMWSERLKHTEKHKINFKTENEYNEMIKNIPNIIKNPDYIGLRESDNSLQYVKQIKKLILVAVRLKIDGEIGFRTAYPITESQIKRLYKKR